MLKNIFSLKKVLFKSTLPGLSGFTISVVIFERFYKNDKRFGQKDMVLDSVFYNDGK